MNRFPPTRWLVAAALLLVASHAHAAENMMAPPAKAAGEIFFPAGSVAVAKVLPPPPTADSLLGRADTMAVLEVQTWRTAEQVDWAKRVAAADFFSLFAEGLLPPEITKQNCPQLVELFRGVYASCAPVNEAAKKLFSRPRPFVHDPRVEPCVERLASESYPSGHAQATLIWADVLGDLFPERKAEIEARARRIGWGRVVGGVHFPSDLAAGEALGRTLLGELRKSPAFRARLEQCRAEIAALRRKKAA